MKQELRVLCGLHRGACLPVSVGDTLSVGADETCDVVLVDEGVRALELSLELHEDGVSVMRSDAQGELQLAHDAAWGQPLVCASVVVTVCDAQDPWYFLTPEQVPPELPVLQDSVDFEPSVPPSSEAEAASVSPKPIWQRWSRGHQMRLGVLAVLMLGFTTYSISRSIQKSYVHAPLSAAVTQENKTVVRQEPLLIAGSLAPADASAPAVALSQADLQRKLKQRLKDVDLYDKLDLELSESSWAVRGALDEDEARLLGRTMAGFYKEYGVSMPLSTLVNSPEEMLPFKIQQFTTGSLASVVTSDGRRLYVGDTHQGYTLQRIEGKKLLFAGKKKIEVIW